MKRSVRRNSLVLGAVLVTGLGVLTGLAGPAASAAAGRTTSGAVLRHACAPASGTRWTCFATYWAHAAGTKVPAGDQPGHMTGLTAKDIKSAYRLPTSSKHPLVAIVDAQDDPKAESDLAVFRKQNGLSACTTANGCFRKVNGQGKTTPLPYPDPDWGVEISLDLDAVSAACPNCHILLVEARSSQEQDLGGAENTAARLGAAVISNSFGGQEYSGTLADGAKYFDHPGIAVVASSGDAPFGIPSDPAVLRNVIAVGGTRLTKSSTARGWNETAWKYAASGCSGYVSKPAWQQDKNCPMRMTADVSAVAAPATGLQVYDTFGLGAYNGDVRVGGTSLSAPLISGMIGLAGNASSLDSAQHIYQHRSALNDVTSGSNGYCGGDYLCTGLPGYDGPTGLGTPNGLGAL